MTMQVLDPNVLVMRCPPPFREGRDLDRYVSACEGARGMLGAGGGAGSVSGPAPILSGGGEATKGLLCCFLVSKGNQPTACTLALWWLTFGPTEDPGGGGGPVYAPEARGLSQASASLTAGSSV